MVKNFLIIFVVVFAFTGCVTTAPIAMGAAYATGDDYNCEKIIIVDGTEECQKNNVVEKTFSGFLKAVKKIFK